MSDSRKIIDSLLADANRLQKLIDQTLPTDKLRRQILEEVRQKQQMLDQLNPTTKLAQTLIGSLPTQAFFKSDDLRSQLALATEAQEKWQSLAFGPPSWVQDFQKAMTQGAVGASAYLRSMNRAMDAFGPIFAELAETRTHAARLDAIGWLPHDTIPSDLLYNDDLSDEALDEAIDNHYRENWATVRETLLARLASLDLDNEAKAVLSQAVAAHEAGIYRATSRLLFPEIERVARAELHNGTMAPITSQKKLRDVAQDLSPSDIEPGGFFGMKLFDKLVDHLYAQTKTPEALANVATDPVPNRHAALHGFVSYASHKSSINMLIMADFVFQVICAVKRDIRESIPAGCADTPD